MKNENRPGYKKTKVGWIPILWKSSELGEQAKIHRGASPRPIKDPKWFAPEGRGWVRISDVTNCQKYLSETTQYLSQQGVSKSVSVNPGNLILSICATIGIPRIVDIPVCIHDGFITLSDLDELNIDYAYYLLVKLTPVLAGLGQHGTQKNINANIVRSIPIPLPPLPEQKAIASVLECWDKVIHKYEEKIEKKKNIKKGLMQRLLSGKQRLPGFSGDLKIKRLEQGVTKFIVPMRDKPKKFCGNIPWCRIDDFDGKYLSICKSNRFVDQETIANMNLKIHPRETVLVSCSANIGICAIVKAPIITNQTFIGLVTDPLILDNEYLYYQMTFRAKQLNAIANGTTISYLSRKEFEQFKIPFPTLSEQEAIASVLSSADSEIKALEKKLTVLKDQKKYLLNNLVTGTIRLPEFTECNEAE